jgi:hypothetical protein
MPKNKIVLSNLSIVDQMYVCTKMIASSRNNKERKDGWNRLVAIVKTGYGYRVASTMLTKKGIDTPVYARQALAYIREIEGNMARVNKLPA